MKRLKIGFVVLDQSKEEKYFCALLLFRWELLQVLYNFRKWSIYSESIFVVSTLGAFRNFPWFGFSIDEPFLK